jgi:hypothetical protein
MFFGRAQARKGPFGDVATESSCWKSVYRLGLASAEQIRFAGRSSGALTARSKFNDPATKDLDM